MRKFLLFIIAIALLGGIGYTGYVIFGSKNISKVEVEGNAQTIYLLNETETPNFQDAKLKITYKSGDVKYVDLKSSNVVVDDFSTSIEASRTMKISYKKQLVTIDYNVIKSGLYYLSSTETTTLNDSQRVSYGIRNTKNFYILEKDGILKYYNYDTNVSKWFLYDGKYKKDYKYEIVADKINIYLGEEAPAYCMQATVVNGDMSVSSTKYTYQDDLQTGKIVTKFTSYDVKDNITVSKAELYSDDFIENKDVSAEKYLEFCVGDTLAENKNEMYIKVNYSSSLIYLPNNDGSITGLLGEVYVVLDNCMEKGSTLHTGTKRSYISYAELAYETKLLTFYYIVVD